MIVRQNPNADPTRRSFERLNTAGDAHRFAAATTGYQTVMRANDIGYGPVVDLGGGSYEFTLPFSYLVATNQLEVYIISAGTANKLINTSVLAAADTANYIATADKTTIEAGPYFEESTGEMVIVHNIILDDLIWFLIPHTSVPGISQNRVTVAPQSDRTALKFLGSGDGWEYVTPDGQPGRVYVTNNHQLVAEKL